MSEQLLGRWECPSAGAWIGSRDFVRPPGVYGLAVDVLDAAGRPLFCGWVAVPAPDEVLRVTFDAPGPDWVFPVRVTVSAEVAAWNGSPLTVPEYRAVLEAVTAWTQAMVRAVTSLSAALAPWQEAIARVNTTAAEVQPLWTAKFVGEQLMKAAFAGTCTKCVARYDLGGSGASCLHLADCPRTRGVGHG